MLEVKVSTVVIEENPEELSHTIELIGEIEELTVSGKTTKGDTGIQLVQNFTPQLLFLNVELNDCSGFDVVRSLHSRNIYPEVIFLARNEDLTYDALQFEPLDYLIKPLSAADIANLMTRLRMKLRKKELMYKMNELTQAMSISAKKVFKQKGGVIVLPVDEIVLFKASGTGTEITLKNNDRVKLKTGIKETLETANNENFVRISRSFCINRIYLRKIEKRYLKCGLQSNGFSWEVPITKSSLAQLERLNVFPIY